MISRFEYDFTLLKKIQILFILSSIVEKKYLIWPN